MWLLSSDGSPMKPTCWSPSRRTGSWEAARPVRRASYRPPGDDRVRWSGADLEAGEPLDLDAGSVEHGLHVLLRVGDRRLVEQGDVLEEPVEPALGDLVDRLLGL